MSSQSKPASRWGSFLQQAVAGVESRLDTILADEDTTSNSSTQEKDTTLEQANKKETLPVPAGVGVGSRSSGEVSRQSSASRKNDRLQERLAKAVVARNAGPKTTESPTLRSQTESPIEGPSSPQSSLDIKNDNESSSLCASSTHSEKLHGQVEGVEGVEGTEVTNPIIRPSSPPTSVAMSSHSPRRLSGSLVFTESLTKEALDSARFLEPSGEATAATMAHYESRIQKMSAYYEAAELRRQEETHQYLEHIDSLHAKLQYLSRETIEIAKKAEQDATPGTSAERLAQKDEKIALLIDEGNKLSQNEMKLLMNIKKLRAKSAEDERRLSLSKQASDKAEKASNALQDHIKQIEISQAEEREHMKKTERELDRMKIDLALKTSKITELQSQVSESKASKPADDSGKIKDLLDAEMKITLNLKDDISTLSVEKKLAEDRHRAQIRELQENADREKERSRISALELKGELGALESCLETYRSRAEEASSGGGRDTQAKLFRQIETLQSQYTVASENWRGIENLLLARIASLEKDRDDLGKKEMDLRRKAREASTKYKQIEEELEQAHDRAGEQQKAIVRESTISRELRELLDKADANLQAAQAEAKAAREDAEAERLDAEKKEQHRLETPAEQIRTLSPLLLNGRSVVDRSTQDRVSPSGRRQHVAGLSGIVALSERPGSRRVSGPPGQGHSVVQRHHSSSSIPQSSSRGSVHSVPQTPSIQTEHHDELFDGVVTPATPERTINDVFSVSTAAAGPSVQLVERMSAAVRRLESEKAASKDELDRFSAQRNEARDQVVSLMREVEQKRMADSKVVTLEYEVKSLSKRYQTTLEMLGEKTERVEELQADISDMKQIYKEVLERTVR